jgi:hypothetical protein
MKGTSIEYNSILLVILIALVFLSLRVVALAKDDSIDREKLCRNEVIEKYKTVATIVSLDRERPLLRHKTPLLVQDSLQCRSHRIFQIPIKLP